MKLIIQDIADIYQLSYEVLHNLAGMNPTDNISKYPDKVDILPKTNHSTSDRLPMKCC